MNIEKIKRKIYKYKAVSFDIFDTLIERDVYKPTDIFMMVENNILNTSSKKNFFEERINAERIARIKNKEPNISDIYRELGYNDKLKERLLNEEIRLELEHCYPKSNIVELVSYLNEMNKNIFLISDMYLPSETIINMLSKCDINNYKKIYVSCECECNKLTGELFKYVLENNDLKSSDVIHIGDSLKADFLGARKVGISSILIQRKNRLGRLLKK